MKTLTFLYCSACFRRVDEVVFFFFFTDLTGIQYFPPSKWVWIYIFNYYGDKVVLFLLTVEDIQNFLCTKQLKNYAKAKWSAMWGLVTLELLLLEN